MNVVQKVFDEESAKLRIVNNGSVTVTYQYMSQSFVDAAHTAGNAMDLNPKDGPLIGTVPLPFEFAGFLVEHMLIEFSRLTRCCLDVCI